MLKKVLIVLTILFSVPLSGNAQYLTLDQLTKLCDSDFNDINEYIVPKGWLFKDSRQETNISEATVKWRFRKGDATLILHNPGPNQYFTYWVTNKAYYDLYKGKIRAYGMQLISNNLQNEMISAVYEGANFVVATSIHSYEDKPSYTMYVGRKEYLLRKLRALENKE